MKNFEDVSAKRKFSNINFLDIIHVFTKFKTNWVFWSNPAMSLMLVPRNAKYELIWTYGGTSGTDIFL